MIGFSQVDYTIDEGAGTVLLLVHVRDGNIPEAGNRIITLTTSDGTAQCMLLLVGLIKLNVDYETCAPTIHSVYLSTNNVKP